MHETFAEYKRTLLDANFKEATKNPNDFYRKATEKTAFIVNLKYLTDGIGIVYGFCSTASLRDQYAEAFLAEYGKNDDECNLRFFVKIGAEISDSEAKKMIDVCYRTYALTEKDILLEIVKEKRKAFVTNVTSFLKPLGFRKKGNSWKKSLSTDIGLGLVLDKNPYTDLYYFEVDVSGASWYHGRRMIHVRDAAMFDYIAEPNAQFDWQLQSEKELTAVLEKIYANVFSPLMKAIPPSLGEEQGFYTKMLDALCRDDAI